MNNVPKRFGWITAGQSTGPDVLSDLPVLSNSGAVVLPTLGSIVPNWVLAVPRECTISIAELSRSSQFLVAAAAEEAAQLMGDIDRVVYFEHGASRTGSAIGCGVDQAHLHVLATGLDFVTPALNDPEVEWRDVDFDHPWDGLAKSEYYLIKTRDRALAGYPRVPISQFFRRHIAAAAGVPERWDYKAWPNYENIRRTYERFNGCVRSGAI